MIGHYGWIQDLHRHIYVYTIDILGSPPARHSRHGLDNSSSFVGLIRISIVLYLFNKEIYNFSLVTIFYMVFQN